jgi:hypothetical protein
MRALFSWRLASLVSCGIAVAWCGWRGAVVWFVAVRVRELEILAATRP